MDLVLNFLTVSRPIKPGNFTLSTEPSDLTLGIASSVTLDYTNRFLSRDTGIDILNHLSIADGFKRFRNRRNTFCQEPADFLDQAGVEHPLDSLIDPSVEILTGRIHADKVTGEACN